MTLGTQNKQHRHTHDNAPKGNGSNPRPNTLDPTIYAHIDNISAHAHKPLQLVTALSTTSCGEQKESLDHSNIQSCYETALGECLIHISHIVAHCIPDQHQQSTRHAERSTENCHEMRIRHKHIQHLHGETLILPTHEHLQLQASQLKQKAQHPSHPLQKFNTY